MSNYSVKKIICFNKIAEFFDTANSKKITIYKSKDFNYYTIYKNDKESGRSNKIDIKKSYVIVNHSIRIDTIEVLKCNEFVVLMNNGKYISKFNMYMDFLDFMRKNYLLHYIVYQKEYEIPAIETYHIKEDGWLFLLKHIDFKKIHSYYDIDNKYFIPRRTEEVYKYYNIILLKYGVLNERTGLFETKYIITNFKNISKINYRFINNIINNCLRVFTEEELRKDSKYRELLQLQKNIPNLIRNYYNQKYEKIRKKFIS